MRLLRPLPVLAALLLAAVAGCVGAPGKTMTARDGLGDAEDAAKDWAQGEDLHLLGLVAVEPFQRVNHTSDDGEDSAEFVTHLDGDPGDGRAPAWAYGFLAGDRCISVILAAGLGVLAEGYATCDGDDTVGDWPVDSSEAASILGQRDDWPDLGPDGTYFWELGSDDGQALWTVAGSGQDGESVTAVVDARTGEVLAVEQGSGEGFGVIPGPSAPSGSPGGSGSDEDQDSATTLTPGQSIAAEVDLGGVGGLVLELSARTTLQGMTLTVEGPAGVIDETPVGPVVGNDYQEHREYGDLPPGHYTVTLSADGVTAFPSVVATAYW
jgi:hypothetical protein